MQPSSEQQQTNKRITDHLANERTFLAWIRTAIGIMAFGFVVVKFSLFVKQLAIIMEQNNHVPQKGFSPTIGILLIASGIVTVLFAYIRYLQVARNINSEDYRSTGKLPAVFTVFVMACGLFLVVYLMMTS